MHTPARGRRRGAPALWSGLVVMMLAGSVGAQPAGDATVTSLPVPGTAEGILDVAGFTAWGGDRASLLLDLVRHLYAAPDADSPAVRAVRRHARTVTEFMEAWRVVRAADGDASLARAADGSARRRLEDLVEAAGFRLRRSSGAYVVRVDDGDDERARRASLRAAGLAVDDLDRRLNDGEALVFELPSFDVPLPLTAEVWHNTVLRARAGDRALLGLRLLADRRAALLYHGLLSMSADTRRFLVANPRLLRDLYEDHTERLALYGRSLAVAGDRVAVPGGADAESLWRSLTSERVDRPDDFIEAVLRQDDGTLAYFYDVVAHLDDAHRRFALTSGSTRARAARAGGASTTSSWLRPRFCPSGRSTGAIPTRRCCCRRWWWTPRAGRRRPRGVDCGRRCSRGPICPAIPSGTCAGPPKRTWSMRAGWPSGCSTGPSWWTTGSTCWRSRSGGFPARPPRTCRTCW